MSHCWKPTLKPAVADKVMPTLPISIMNVMDGMRGNPGNDRPAANRMWTKPRTAPLELRRLGERSC